MTTFNLEQTLSQAEAIAKQAGAIVRAHSGRARQINHKGVVNLVTRADLESETFIVDQLTRAFPSHHVHAEEGGDAGASDASANYTWYVDPLDGTTNFAHGLDIFSVSLALAGPDGVALLGVVYDPMRDECYSAARGLGAKLNDAPIHVSSTPTLSQALASTGFPYDRWTAEVDNLAEWGRFMKRVQGVRRLGSAALDLAWVAAGRLDLYWEQRLYPWDVLAGALIVEEAGGRVTDFTGDPDGYRTGQAIVATNGLIHDEALAVFRLGDEAPLPTS